MGLARLRFHAQTSNPRVLADALQTGAQGLPSNRIARLELPWYRNHRVNSKNWQHGCRLIHAGIPSFCRLGWRNGMFQLYASASTLPQTFTLSKYRCRKHFEAKAFHVGLHGPSGIMPRAFTLAWRRNLYKGPST